MIIHLTRIEIPVVRPVVRPAKIRIHRKMEQLHTIV